MSRDDGSHPEVLTATSVTKLGAAHAGQVLIAGSHGGIYAGYRAGLRAVILNDAGGDLMTAGEPPGGTSAIRIDVLACAFNDAGVGADRVGISRLPALDRRGIAAVTVDCNSARIGDVRSMWQNGRVSYVIRGAEAVGAMPGMMLRDVAAAVAATATKPGGKR